MSVGNHSKLAVGALGALLAGSTLGFVPVGRFVGPRAPVAPQPPVIPCPVARDLARARVGPLTLEAGLSQTAVYVGADGNLYLDVRVTADAAPAEARRPVDLALVLDTSGSMMEQDRLGLLKQACERLAKDLGPEDRVALVTFSTDSSTVFPLAPVSAAYIDAVKNLVACGGTNIASGLERGAAELKRAARPGVARRLLLLTDGQPTVGVQQPEALKTLARKLSGEGFSVSAVGLGLDFNAPLLSGMAELGGGVYHYVDQPGRIAGIYDAELRSLRSLVARDVVVSIQPAPGFELVRAIEWQAQRTANGFDVRVGDLEAGRATKIVAQLRWTGRPDCGRGIPERLYPVVNVSARAVVAKDGQVAQGAVDPLSVGLTADRAAAEASRNPLVARDVDDAVVSDALEQARAKAEAGDVAGARSCLKQVGAVRPEVQYKAADGRVEKMNVVELERALCDEPAGESNARAQRFSRSAASQAAK